MARSTAARFAIRFDGWYRALSLMLFLPPAASFVDVGDDDVVVRMAWAFSARFARAAVLSAGPVTGVVLSRGVHGWAGRWLVNGSGDRIVSIRLAPGQRAVVLGFPVSLRELLVSVDSPAALSAALLPIPDDLS